MNPPIRQNKANKNCYEDKNGPPPGGCVAESSAVWTRMVNRDFPQEFRQPGDVRRDPPRFPIT